MLVAESTITIGPRLGPTHTVRFSQGNYVRKWLLKAMRQTEFTLSRKRSRGANGPLPYSLRCIDRRLGRYRVGFGSLPDFFSSLGFVSALGVDFFTSPCPSPSPLVIDSLLCLVSDSFTSP